MELESYIRDRCREKGILLMTHIMLGYPSFEECFHIIEAMVKAGADLMELQIPFSEPIADGPTILRANQVALENGVGVEKCLDFAADVANTFEIPFLIMTYFNIVFRYGLNSFISAMADNKLQGAIIADLPPEEAGDYLRAMKDANLHPIFMFSPTTGDERMRHIASLGRGFIYCVARKGVTGAQTSFSEGLAHYLARCRRATSLPLAVGFGVKEKRDVSFLRGKAHIAVIGSQAIRVIEEQGIHGLEDFIRGLR